MPFRKLAGEDMGNRLTAYARANRKRMTPAECALWEMVRSSRLGVRFRRQEPVRFWIADFYCASARLILEIDGGYHAAKEAKDAHRTISLEQLGLRVIRFTNRQVLETPQATRSAILRVITTR